MGDTTPVPGSPSATNSAAAPTPAPSTVGCADVDPTLAGRIAFTLRSGNAAGIATIAADGSAFVQVVEPGPDRPQPHAGTAAPHWLPEDRILFGSNRAGGPDDWHLFVVDARGGDPRQLTSGSRAIEYHGVPAPDASTIAYAKAVATRDPAQPFREAGIFISDADGGGERQLTSPPDGTFDEWPDISPDGTRVAFTRALGGAPGSARSAILVVNLDGTMLHEITDPKLNAIRPRWAPDGSLLVFSSNADNYSSASANVWSVAPDGTGLRQLTFASGTAQAFFPDWSPDGRHLVFLDHRAGSGTQDLAIIGRDGDFTCTLWSGMSSHLAGDPDWGTGASAP